MKRLCSLVLALALCLGLCVPAGAAEFSDVPAGHAFYGGILYCAENGIIGGYSDGTFGGEVTMNRGQAAVVIYRMTQAVPVEAPAPETPAPETPADPEPETPSTPTTPKTPSTPAAGTLTNGKAITETNITEILNQLKSRYPNGTSFVNGYAGLNSGRGPTPTALTKLSSNILTQTARNAAQLSAAVAGPRSSLTKSSVRPVSPGKRPPQAISALET